MKRDSRVVKQFDMATLCINTTHLLRVHLLLVVPLLVAMVNAATAGSGVRGKNKGGGNKKSSMAGQGPDLHDRKTPPPEVSNLDFFAKLPSAQRPRAFY